MCDGPSGVTDRLEFGLCQTLLPGSQSSPHTLLCMGCFTTTGDVSVCVGLLWGVWVSEASPTTKEELS